MHYLFFVLLPKDHAETATGAMDAADSVLENNNFAGNHGFYSTPKADRYEVWWRWHWVLQQTLLWEDVIIADDTPDAMLITDKLRLKLMEDYSDVECFDVDALDEYEVSKLNSKHNDMRIVAIDYHN